MSAHRHPIEGRLDAHLRVLAVDLFPPDGPGLPVIERVARRRRFRRRRITVAAVCVGLVAGAVTAVGLTTGRDARLRTISPADAGMEDRSNTGEKIGEGPTGHTARETVSSTAAVDPPTVATVSWPTSEPSVEGASGSRTLKGQGDRTAEFSSQLTWARRDDIRAVTQVSAGADGWLDALATLRTERRGRRRRLPRSWPTFS